MQLTRYTDYSLRMLIYLCLVDEATIGEIAERFNISHNHLVKVAHSLGKAGYIHTMRGRTGGLRLARAPEQITVGQVVRDMEPHFHMVECCNPEAPHCAILPVCALRGVLLQAERAFMQVLYSYTLADLMQDRETLRSLLGITRPATLSA